jgi:hypothetical protein
MLIRRVALAFSGVSVPEQPALKIVHIIGERTQFRYSSDATVYPDAPMVSGGRNAIWIHPEKP